MLWKNRHNPQPNKTSIPSAATLRSSRDERASLDTSVEVSPSSISASTPDVKKLFLKSTVHLVGTCRIFYSCMILKC